MKVGVAVVQCSSQSFIILLPISCMLITSIFLFIFCRCTFDCTVFCHCFPDQIVVYKRLAGAYPLRDFHKICRICTLIQDASAVKMSSDVLKGLWSYGCFMLTESGYPEIFSAPQQRNYASDPQKFQRCKNVLEVLYHHVTFDGARISLATGTVKNVEFFVCLSVCLFVRHAFERQSLCTRFRHKVVGAQKQFYVCMYVCMYPSGKGPAYSGPIR